MDDWRRQQISERLEKFAKSSRQEIESVASIKFRFMRGSDGTDQIYLGGHEYQIVDSAVESFLVTKGLPFLEYEHHESGPEIIGVIADLIGIAGGIYGAWQFIQSRISSGLIGKGEYQPFKGMASLSIEVRQKLSNGEVHEKRVKLVKVKGNVSEREMKSALKKALKIESKKGRK
jgi:hypothetical protein